MDKRYIAGFMRKCAELGLDPEGLVKLSQALPAVQPPATQPKPPAQNTMSRQMMTGELPPPPKIAPTARTSSAANSPVTTQADRAAGGYAATGSGNGPLPAANSQELKDWSRSVGLGPKPTTWRDKRNIQEDAGTPAPRKPLMTASLGGAKDIAHFNGQNAQTANTRMGLAQNGTVPRQPNLVTPSVNTQFANSQSNPITVSNDLNITHNQRPMQNNKTPMPAKAPAAPAPGARPAAAPIPGNPIVNDKSVPRAAGSAIMAGTPGRRGTDMPERGEDSEAYKARMARSYPASRPAAPSAAPVPAAAPVAPAKPGILMSAGQADQPGGIGSVTPIAPAVAQTPAAAPVNTGGRAPIRQKMQDVQNSYQDASLGGNMGDAAGTVFNDLFNGQGAQQEWLHTLGNPDPAEAPGAAESAEFQNRARNNPNYAATHNSAPPANPLVAGGTPAPLLTPVGMNKNMSARRGFIVKTGGALPPGIFKSAARKTRKAPATPASGKVLRPAGHMRLPGLTDEEFRKMTAYARRAGSGITPMRRPGLLGG